MHAIGPVSKTNRLTSGTLFLQTRLVDLHITPAAVQRSSRIHKAISLRIIDPTSAKIIHPARQQRFRAIIVHGANLFLYAGENAGHDCV